MTLTIIDDYWKMPLDRRFCLMVHCDSGCLSVKSIYGVLFKRYVRNHPLENADTPSNVKGYFQDYRIKCETIIGPGLIRR